MSLISEYALRRAFRPSVRAKLWRRLAARAALGLPVWDAIEDARGRAEGKNPGFARACGRLLLARDSGLGLADGLGGLGAPGEGLLLSAGESSGRTAEGLSLAAELLETRGRVAKEVKSGLAYPVFLVLLSVIVLVLTSGLIVPQLAAVLDPESWTGAAAWLYALSGFLNSSRGLFLGLVLILLIILTVTSLGTWTGPLRQRLDAFGPWKLHALSEGSAFLFTLATLSRAGVQTRVVLETCLASPSSSPWLRERLRGVLRVYGNGTNLGDALAGAENGVTGQADQGISREKRHGEPAEGNGRARHGQGPVPETRAHPVPEEPAHGRCGAVGAVRQGRCLLVRPLDAEEVEAAPVT